jgi:hypothetical protein
MQATLQVPAQAAAETQAGFARYLIAMICGLGVVMFVTPTTYGLDLSIGFF